MNEVNKITLGQLTCQATHLGYPDPVSLEQILREKGTLTFLCLLDRIEVANARRCLSYRFLQVLLFIYVDSAICLSKGVAKIYNELGINQLEIDGNDYTAPVFGQQYLKTLSDHYLSDQSPLTVYDKALVNALSHFDHPWVIHSIVSGTALDNRLNNYPAVRVLLEEAVEHSLSLTKYQ